MDDLLFRITPRQLRGVRVYTAVLALVTVGLAALAHFRLGLGTYLQALTIVTGVCCLLALWASFAYAGAFTQCSPDGIRIRGLFGVRTYNCPWTQIAKIGLLDWQGSTRIEVTRRDGSRFRLGVPIIAASMPDPNFDAKYGQILSYWREIASHGVSGPQPSRTTGD
jgi:hypothetical protein